MIRMAQEAGSSSRIVEAVVAVNSATKSRMAVKIQEALGGSVQDKVIAVLGLTFKPETDDMRDAPSLTILPTLLEVPSSRRFHQALPTTPTVISSTHQGRIGQWQLLATERLSIYRPRTRLATTM